jgi:hypothetical protein
MNKTLIDDFKMFVKKVDPRSWPATIMFVVVLSAAGGLNYIGLTPIVGGVIAVFIAMFFGFGVLSWHIIEARTDDSAYQESVASFVKWLNVILDGILIVLNLFRADLRTATTPVSGMSWFDILAFVIVGISASSHVIGYLLWTQNDPVRELNKKSGRDLHTISMKRQDVGATIKQAEAELEAHKYAMDEEIRLRSVYKDLPAAKVELIISAMKKGIEEKFKVKLGEEASGSQASGRPTQPSGRVVYPAQTPRPVPTPTPTPVPVQQTYTLQQFLQINQMTEDQARGWLETLGGKSEAWKTLRDQGLLPLDMVHRNFDQLCDELLGTPNP